MVRRPEDVRNAISRAIALGASLLVQPLDEEVFIIWNYDLKKYMVLDQDNDWQEAMWFDKFNTRDKKYEKLLKHNEIIWKVNPAHENLEPVEDVYIFNPLVSQVAGVHYKDRAIQPIEYIIANNLNFNKGNVVKYITRYEDKGGINDLAKVVHYTLLEAFAQYGEKGSTELALKIKEILNID